MSSLIALLAASAAAVPVSCNSVSADGHAAQLQLTLDPSASTIGLVRQTDGLSIQTHDAHFEDDGKVSFTAAIDGKPLKFELWGGFFRKQSLLDGVDADSSSPSFGLSYLAGICGPAANVMPIKQTLGTASGNGGADGCSGVTIDGKAFRLRFHSAEGQLHFALEGEGYFDFVDRPLRKNAFPPLPENENVFASWTSYETEGDGRPASFVLEFMVNKQSLLQTSILDFQTLGISGLPLMVARVNCGYRQTETRKS